MIMIISLYLNCWAPMLFDAISIYIMKYRAEHACIYELWLIHGCIDRPVAEKLDRWMDRSIFVLYASWYYIDITYSHRLILHIICYTLKQHIACLIQDFVNRYKMPTKSRSTIAGVGRCFFIQKKVSPWAIKRGNGKSPIYRYNFV